MKQNILFVFLFIALNGYSQTDSVALKIGQLQGAIIYMRDNLKESHEEFQIGAGLSIGGLVITGIGIAIEPKYDSKGRQDATIKNVVTIGGALIGLFGNILIIDSHKFIGRAGRWKFTGNAITFKL